MIILGKQQNAKFAIVVYENNNELQTEFLSLEVEFKRFNEIITNYDIKIISYNKEIKKVNSIEKI